MAPTPEDPKQEEKPANLAVIEKSEADFTLCQRLGGGILALRDKFLQTIGATKEGVDNSVWQPMLKRLQTFQKKERKAPVGPIRQKFKNVFESDAYKAIDKWLLTYFAILGPQALTYLAAQTDSHIDEDTKEAFFHYLNMGLTAGFAIDLVGNTTAKGSKYWFSVDPKLEIDGVDHGKLALNWENAPLVNVLAVAGGTTELGGGVMRLARLVRMGRLARLVRVSNIHGVTDSLEDESVEMHLKSKARSLFKKITALAGMSATAEPDYTNPQTIALYIAGALFIAHSIERENFESRAIQATVYTRRFEALDKSITHIFRSNPLLKHLEKAYQMGGNEFDKLEEKIANFFNITEEIQNPTGENFESDDNGLPKTKFVDRTVMFTDVRGFTALSHHYPVEKMEDIMASYLSDMYPIVRQYGGRFANLMGDGTALFFKDQVDEKTGEIIPSAEQAIRCAVALQDHSKRYDEIFQRELPIPGKQVSHTTGIGINSGRVFVADPFRKLKGTMVIHRAEIGGDAVNTTARVESLNKQFPGHIVLVTQSEYQGYPKELQSKFRYCGIAHMKGIGEVPILGIPEDENANYAYDIDSFVIVSKDEENE